MSNFKVIYKMDIIHVMNLEAQGDTLRQHMSSDSLELPWHVSSRRPIVVSESQTGRQVGPDSFFLCFIAVLELAAGTGLFSVCIWSLLKKFAYIHLIDIAVDITYFSIPGALICFVCFWIAASIINSKNPPFLLLLLIFLLFSCILLLTGSYMGFVYKSKVKFNNSNSNELLSKISKAEFVASMGESIVLYDFDHGHKSNWDSTQTIFQCCGILNATDWTLTRGKIPDSCCFSGNCTEENSFRQNCVDAVAYDIYWFKVFISNLNIMVSSCHILSIVLMIYINYWWRKH